MKVDLNRRELQLIKLWWLCCEDMMVPNGTCNACEFKEECEVVRQKLYKRKPKSSAVASVYVYSDKHDP